MFYLKSLHGKYKGRVQKIQTKHYQGGEHITPKKVYWKSNSTYIFGKVQSSTIIVVHFFLSNRLKANT